MTWSEFKAAVESRGVIDEMELHELNLSWREDDPDGPYSFAITVSPQNGVKMWNTYRIALGKE